jgi:predicted nucleic acid-binding protein
VLNVAARRWSWDERALVKLVATLRAFRFDIRDSQIERVASWAARGLSAYDATYVALAEAEGIELITDDDLILDVATGVARRLSAG